eukprot:2298708-Rhodomonas_salina.4
MALWWNAIRGTEIVYVITGAYAFQYNPFSGLSLALPANAIPSTALSANAMPGTKVTAFAVMLSSRDCVMCGSELGYAAAGSVYNNLLFEFSHPSGVPLFPYSYAPRCQLLRWAMMLLLCYAMFGTEIGYATFQPPPPPPPLRAPR